MTRPAGRKICKSVLPVAGNCLRLRRRAGYLKFCSNSILFEFQPDIVADDTSEQRTKEEAA